VESPERGTVRATIVRLHLEEDAGKSLHDRIPGATAVDLNRAGTPLAEIVGGPDLRSPAEARSYLVTLRQLLVHAGVSECSMEKGSLRVDANLSVRRPGEPLGVKTELKNLNSFANVERALESERARQIALLESGGRVDQVTLTFNAATGEVKPLRSKEDAHDYRYFPDPDLPPLVLSSRWIGERKAELPELPAARKARYAALGLPEYDTIVLSQELPVAGYFEELLALGTPAKMAANWVMGEVISGFNAEGRFPVSASRVAELAGLVDEGVVSLQAAKRVYAELVTADDGPRAVAERLGLIQVRDTGALEEWIDAVIAAHPDEVARFRGGEAKLTGFFVGQVMKRSGGKADPKAIQPLLARRLAP
jgi:aspartyl-tRNA(Asn)/glutamyl-tRNA(Gln) amidotransferase subunit B